MLFKWSHEFAYEQFPVKQENCCSGMFNCAFEQNVQITLRLRRNIFGIRVKFGLCHIKMLEFGVT